MAPDFEAVADDAGFDRFALMAMAQGGPVAIEYAARHPERLTRLVFYGSYAGALADAASFEVAFLATAAVSGLAFATTLVMPETQRVRRLP